MKKRITAALLSVVLCLALLGTAALGAEPQISVTAKAGEAHATVTASGLQADTEYNMCAIGRGGELLALFNAKTNADGDFTETVPVGTLAEGQTLTVTIPAVSGADAVTGSGTVEEGTTPTVYHTITASAGAGGTISPDGAVTVAEGENKTFSISANSGYSISDVKVDNVSKGSVRTYVFENVSENHTISATFTSNGGGGGNGGGSGGGGGGSSGGGGGGGGASSASKAPDVSKNAGGSVKVSSDGKTVTITPDAGYRIKDVIINGESVGAVSKYVFDKASKDNTVKVIFEKITDDTGKPASDVSRFTDVSGHWAANAISFVVERGLFNGVSDTQFGPNTPMTRAMLVTVLYRLDGEPAGGSGSFADVPAGQWYTQAVAWAASEGVVQGTQNGFEPNGNITREQLATILYRYAALKKADVSVHGDMSRFTDAGNISGWAGQAMSWAVGAGILGGTDAGTLNPGGNASRAEVATMLMRLVEYMD